MPGNELHNGIHLMHAEPVLAVKDVVETVSYWRDQLGFTDTWTWGEPANHGGVSWNGVYVQFSLNNDLAESSKGNCIWIRVRHLNQLYKLHQERNVDVVEQLENKPWGLAQYTVKEINGYYIVFAGAALSEIGNKDESVKVRIKERIPTTEEYLKLATAVGWKEYIRDIEIGKVLSAPIFAVVAEDESSGEIIGCALLMGDDASFYYVKDVMVLPFWQRKKVGSMMMKTLTDWLDQHAPETAFVTLISSESLAEFYGQFDFTPVFGMHRKVRARNR